MMRGFMIGLVSLMLVIAVPQIAHPSQSLLQQGIVQYENANFSEAIQLWQRVNQDFANQKDGLGQALALNHLSLAYQQLGQLQLAEQSLDQSLKLLASSNRSQAQIEIYAKALNTQGKLYWLQSKLEQALTAWQKSAQGYAQVGNSRGIAIAQLNQAKALQALGFSRQAQSLLQQIYEHSQSLTRELRAIVLRDLGNVLRQVGELNASRDRLRESLSLARSSLIYLELGNTERAIADRLRVLGRKAESQSHLQDALNHYEQAINLNGLLSAQLNRFSLLIETGQSDKAEKQLPLLQQAIQKLPPSRTAIYAAIHLSEHAMRLSKLDSINIAHLLSSAIQQARQLKDVRAEAYALGQLGGLYEKTQQWTEARSLTQKALLKMESIQAPEIRYRWEWQLARLAQFQNDPKGAIVGYGSAIATLKSIRNDLLNVNPDVQFSFRDNVEPLYREFIQLLLTSEQQPNQAQLEQAIQTVDELQLAELENYLGCSLANLRRVNESQNTQAAILYPILLRDTKADQLAVIVQLPQASKFLYYKTSIPKGKTEATLQDLRENLAVPGRTPEVLADAKTVYDWMIQPIHPELTKHSVKTLVFVLDGALRNVPMSVLYDGKQHLIEQYAVAIAPRLQIFAPKLATEPLKVTLGGVGIPQTINGKQFPPILKFQEELDRIAQTISSSPPLINESFTTQNIRRALKKQDFSVIHWKTHGSFSSDPAETYVVAYRERISTQTLHDLIQISSQGGVRPLELLVLSACETARGDDRAVLGLAGLAARTGTRSVLSTLWTAQDTPNTEFMVQFYRSLSQPGTTTSEAVRQAQLALIQRSGYTTPHIWGNYVLIGNWQ